VTHAGVSPPGLHYRDDDVKSPPCPPAGR